MSTRLVRALAAVLLGAAAGAVGAAAPAHAAACPAGTGVTVVVNGSVGCDRDGGGRASDNFSAAGHALKYAARAPGFVCRVDGAPAGDPCVEASPSDAYWGLFWSDGKSGSWVYSSLGVTSLKVPAGGSVAFVFQGSQQRTPPSVAPPVAPKKEPTRPAASGDTAAKKTSRPSGEGASSKDAPVARSQPSATTAPGSVAPSTRPTGTPATPSPTASATTQPTTATPPPGHAVGTAGDGDGSVQPLAAESDASGTSAPVIAAGLVLVVVLGAAAGVVWRRRRESDPA
ncbi:hypothetical protein [Aeromicrobium duanguangcaii]|uniref:DUF4430 domain-containing protein n=1 Tax=Aeromicrobium duanguangcaii TaxID=2968086 RepID=A0ABY5KDW5_9ACTN|nr:hypothetical protein [Aeromicrobium duanguangcaii]MCD9155128.1 hypothetical protein [Aeromicrobium duanguangcaii]UUI68218.1 hypothetical protein NP095_13550 [Aeromicrobium duanguangcaii]